MKIQVQSSIRVRAQAYAFLGSNGKVVNNEWYGICDVYFWIENNFIGPDERKQLTISRGMEPAFTITLDIERFSNPEDAIAATLKIFADNNIDINSGEAFEFVTGKKN